MRSQQFAELLLSFVASRDRASAMLGDLVEDFGGSWRFWIYVIRTAISQLWRQMAKAPFSMIRPALLTFCLEIGLIIVWGFARALWVSPDPDFPSVFHADLPWLQIFLTCVFVPFIVAPMFRRHPGREGAGILTLTFIHAMINASALAVCGIAALTGSEAHFDVTIGVPLISWDGDLSNTLDVFLFYLTLYPLILFAGAAAVPQKWVKWAVWPFRVPVT